MPYHWPSNCKICGKQFMSTTPNATDCGSQDAQHQAARYAPPNPARPPKKDKPDDDRRKK